MTGWRESRRLALAGVVCFLIVQLTVPISRFGVDDIAPRFGWQMFSSVVPSPKFEVITETGSQEVESAEYLAHARADIDLETWMPPHLCEVVPGAVAVRWADREIRC